MESIIANYDDVIPIPMIIYNPTNNALVFNNAVQTTSCIASTEGEILEFSSPVFKQSVQVGLNANLSDFFSNAITIWSYEPKRPSNSFNRGRSGYRLGDCNERRDEVMFRHIWYASLWRYYG